MASYAELIVQDVCVHDSRDAYLWPSPVTELVQSIQKELRIPNWLKSYSVPYTSERVIHLLDQLRASDDASNIDLWDDVEVIDVDVEEQLHVVFNTALVDCARIQAVVETENLADAQFPKESFLVVLVRNAISNPHPRLSLLEEVPVVFPRHPSREAVPILKFMTRSFYAPLVVSILQEMPVEGTAPDPGRESRDEEVESLFKEPHPTMSEFLDACENPKTQEEVEEESADQGLPPQFDAYFLAFSSSSSVTPPSICHVPVLCMADEERFPVLMSSLLYQRRMWRINDPMVGLEFSKYDTTIRLFVGWLGNEPILDRALPQVHIGEIGTPVKLDLSTPSGALVVARLLCTLESRIFAVHDSIRHSVGAVVSDARSRSSLSWRIDTDTQAEGSLSVLENNNKRDLVIRWVKSQEYSGGEGTMAPRKQGGSTRGSATSVPSPQHSTSPRSFTSPPASSVASKLTPEVEERHAPGNDDDVPTFLPRLSCSNFAATKEEDDHRVFRWMFDRRVVPQALATDLIFCEEYTAMTGFIWPEEWRSEDDLPRVDPVLRSYVKELLESVTALKTRPGAVTYYREDEFPVKLRVLEENFSAIFQASHRSREKTKHPEIVNEMEWRHDHDRLLYDFFIRLVQPEGDVANYEDPRSRPTLETTLRFQKSDNLQTSERERLQKLIYGLLRRENPELKTWVLNRGGSTANYIQELKHASYVSSQLIRWMDETIAETEAQSISALGQFPSTGKCDALGRLLVELPNLPYKAVSHFPLVVRATGKGGGDSETLKVKASSTGSRPKLRGGQDGLPTNTSNSSLAVPDGSRPAGEKRYAILSTAIASSMQFRDVASSVDALASKVQQLRLSRGDTTSLELPVLAVEYKKASEQPVKGTNQLRMYLTASIKFLQAAGITNFAVYGVQADGPIAVIPAAILQDDFVHLFERLVERVDISTPLGAWHYATILCRLAEKHVKILETKFEEVQGNLVASLREKGNQMEGWTMDNQTNKLKAENKAKSPPKEKKESTA